MLDAFGPIGGHNFAWAWATGRLAGLGASRVVQSGYRRGMDTTTTRTDLRPVCGHGQGRAGALGEVSRLVHRRVRRRRADRTREGAHRAGGAHAVQCPYCIDAYTTGSLEKGATPEQMTEAVHVAAAIRGGASLVHGVQMRNRGQAVDVGSIRRHCNLYADGPAHPAQHAFAARVARGAARDARSRCRSRDVRGGPGAAPARDRCGPLQPTVLQVNVGKRCNQACHHCHVDAGPDRTEVMPDDVVDAVLGLLEQSGHPDARHHRRRAGAASALPRDRRARARLGRHVMDRCNLTITTLPNYADLPEFLAAHRVEVVASLPSYAASQTDRQRGDGVFEQSIAALRRFNALGYGRDGIGPGAEPRHQPGRRVPAGGAGGARARLEARAEAPLRHRLQPAVHHHQHADQPLSRMAGALGQPAGYMRELVNAFNPATVERPDVPLHAERRLGRPALRLRLQSDARSRPAAHESSTGCRPSAQSSPGRTASAAPPAPEARAAARLLSHRSTKPPRTQLHPDSTPDGSV